jgi:peptidoglycan/LPS O-acetylase OafA/YrhL
VQRPTGIRSDRRPRRDVKDTRSVGGAAGDGRATTDRGFRADIQGLRAVAVLLVLTYHLWPTTVTGGFVGVDVFFVISGFLITAHLLQHPPRHGHDLLEFWGRRIRRLLPAAFAVLAVTAVASRLLAPDTQWASIATQTIASAFYVQNWVLAVNSVDYLAAAEAPTPVQHYWSLSVEEQFYVVWPILILALFWFAGRARIWPLLVTRIAMLAVIAGSLYVSITATAADPANAYFITPTRVWELAAGGLVATLPSLGAWRLPGRLVDGAAWIGLAMLLVAGAVISADTPFPGTAAILPVAGTALVIFAAASGRWSPTRFLRLRPIQHLGDTSYSIYLWHWPLIALWPYALGPITPVGSAVIIAATIGLASITKVHVEDRFRFMPSLQPLWPTFRFAVVGMLVLAIAGSGQLLDSQLRLNAAIASVEDGTDLPDVLDPGPTDNPSTVAPGSPGASGQPPQSAGATPGITTCIGAAAIVRGFDACPQNPAAKMIPAPVAASTDKSHAYRDGCWNYAPFATRTTCTYGSGPVKVALVGNSHAGQWLPALEVLAKQHGWTITTYLASQCSVTDAPLEFYSSAKSTGCTTYGAWVVSQVKGKAFDLVFWSERQSVATKGDSWSETDAAAVAGYTPLLKALSAAGTNVLVVQDTPYPGSSIPDCLALHTTNEAACNGTPSSWDWMNPLYDTAVSLALPGISTMESHSYLCTATVCPAVIGTVIAYFDASHMTATYARTLAPFVDAPITAALELGAQ